jgi:hypothetical protein
MLMTITGKVFAVEMKCPAKARYREACRSSDAAAVVRTREWCIGVDRGRKLHAHDGAADATPSALRGVDTEEQLGDLAADLEPGGQHDAGCERDSRVTERKRRCNCMLDASDQRAVALVDKRLRAWAMHIAQCQLEFGQEEGIEHVDCELKWDSEFADGTSEGVDCRQ